MGTNRATGPAFGRVPGTAPPDAGGISRAEVQRLASDEDVEACYGAFIGRHPGIEGRIVVTVVVGSDGIVEKATITSSSFRDATLEQCVRDVAAEWTFSPPTDAKSLVLKVPFQFQTDS